MKSLKNNQHQYKQVNAINEHLRKSIIPNSVASRVRFHDSGIVDASQKMMMMMMNLIDFNSITSN